MAHFIQTHRGGKPLLYESYKYLKTNNNVEGWHLQLVRKSHPNIFEIINVIQKEQPVRDETWPS